MKMYKFFKLDPEHQFRAFDIRIPAEFKPDFYYSFSTITPLKSTNRFHWYKHKSTAKYLIVDDLGFCYTQDKRKMHIMKAIKNVTDEFKKSPEFYLKEGEELPW